MGFKYEKDLVNNFIKKISHENKTSIILKEVNTNFGIPDILIVNLDENILEKRKNFYSDIDFTRIMTYIMTYLYKRRWLKKETLQEYFSLSKAKTEREINKLYKLGLIDTKDNYLKSKSSDEILVINRIFSYEAKLTDWKYAIKQAERHLWFTNDSYVLMPKKNNRVIDKTIKLCKDNDVGLTLFLEENNIKNKIRPKGKGIINSPFIWKLNEEIIRGEVNWARKMSS
mgnify:CR=1 FL=1